MLIIFGIVGMFITGIRRGVYFNFIPVYVYLFSLLSIFLVQVFKFGFNSYMINSLAMYSLLIIYWLLYFHKYGLETFKSMLVKTIPLVYIIALFGILQYFYSPNLFGLLNENTSKGIEWAKDLPFIQYATFFRASSFLGSPQVYGLFMALSIILVHSIKKYNSVIGIVFLFVAGSLSGNKSFFLIILIFYMYKLYLLSSTKRIKILLSIVILLSVAMLIPSKYIEGIKIINRIVNIDNQITQEKEDSRINRYIYTVDHANIFIGNGFGFNTNRQNKLTKVAESYIFQIWGELGVIALSLFMVFLSLSWFFAKDKLFKEQKILIFSIFISMIVVHAFNSPIFFIFWGIILSAFTNKGVLRYETAN